MGTDFRSNGAHRESAPRPQEIQSDQDRGFQPVSAPGEGAVHSERPAERAKGCVCEKGLVMRNCNH